jgi:feruloyl-CoA synthase
VGGLRAKIILAGAPLVQDVVLTGHDRDYLGAMIFPHLPSCRERCPDLPADSPPSALLAHPRIREHFQTMMATLAAGATGSSNYIARALLLEEPPSIDKGEVTDKGSINQRAVLTHRAERVESLYTEKPGAGIFVAPKRARSS